VKPKRTPFPWVTNINESSIDELKRKITVTWADIEDVNEATLAISVDTQKLIITDDSDLRKTLKVMAIAGTLSFNVSLETCTYTHCFFIRVLQLIALLY
jgi:hypothetical protein